MNPHLPSAPSSPSATFTLTPLRLLPPTLVLLVTLLTGCATQNPGMPGDPVLSTGQTSDAKYTPTPGGPLQAITPGKIASYQIIPTEPPKELWERIRRGFAMPDLRNDLVTEREQWYASRPDYTLRMTERSSKYLFHIVEELERRQMPTELALLPFIESAFNPQAVSSAKAAGMWQFMPATGKYFDLKQNVFRDDRRDVLASTRAALDYLQKLYGMFGDWHLALAAYNWGEGSVSRAIAKNQKAGLGTSYEDLNMPAETRLYVPKLQAVKNIIANPEGFRTELPLIGNHPYFQQVQLSRDIDVSLAASLADVKIEDFKALNPSAKRPVILASGTPQILLPWDNAFVFQRNFNAYTQGQYASWTAWVAPRTMKTSEAAEQTGMDEAELRSVNNIPAHMLIKAGSTLLVPRASAKAEDDVTSHVADNAQVSLAPEIVLQRKTVKARKGESVASIAKRYGLAIASVADWNNVSAGSAFKRGSSVVLFMPARAGRSQSSASSSRSSSKASKASKRSSAKTSKRSSSKKVSRSKRR